MRLAALQMQATPGDVAANLARIGAAAERAAAAGAALLVAPELAVTGYGAGDAFDELAEPAEGAAVASLAELAAATGVAIVAGFAERDGRSVYNSAVFADGRRRPTVYRKSHLYGPYERSHFAASPPQATLVEFSGLRLGMLICYDVEFPANVRRLARAGADAVLVPTALPTGPHAAFIAGSMIAVRAFENQLFVAYANHAGADGRFAYAGRSVIAAPDGSLLAEAPATGEALLLASIDRDAYRASALENTYLDDLQP